MTYSRAASRYIAPPAPKWQQHEVIELCRVIEEIAPAFGAHVAMTGGALYKLGPRKDADILFYRIRQAPEVRRDDLLQALERNIPGLRMVETYGWVQKAIYLDKLIDFFFPDHVDEEADPEYQPRRVVELGEEAVS